jgi:hypothetical protein
MLIRLILLRIKKNDYPDLERMASFSTVSGSYSVSRRALAVVLRRFAKFPPGFDPPEFCCTDLR